MKLLDFYKFFKKNLSGRRAKIKLLANSDLFDARWYLRRYPDVKAAGLDPYVHYLDYGASELRNPGPLFETALYVEKNPECTISGENPLIHCLVCKEGPLNLDEVSTPLWRETAALISDLIDENLFDADWYCARYPDVNKTEVDAFLHFINHGAAEHRDPGPRFDTDYYLELCPQARDFPYAPIYHFLKFGRSQGVIPTLPPYERWRNSYDALSMMDMEIIARDCSTLSKITVHVVISEFQTPGDRLRDSLDAQLFRNWQFHNDLAGLKTSAGSKDYVFVCGADIVLQKHCFYMMVKAAEASGALVVYSDEDELSDNQRDNPKFKPQYSPEMFKHIDYIGRSYMARVDKFVEHFLTIESIKDWREAKFNLFKDCDRSEIAHVPAILFHDEIGGNLPQITGKSKTSAFEERIPDVSIIIPTRNKLELLQSCVESILKKSNFPFDKYELIIVDNNSTELDVLRYLSLLSNNRSARIIRDELPFNFARLNNEAAKIANGKILIFVNNDTVVLDKDWISKLVRHAVLPDVGCVGAKLLYPDDMIQHAGVVLGVKGVAGHTNVGLKAADNSILYDVDRERSSVTGACLAIRAALFEQLGGFDETLAVAFNDVDLCVSALAAGLRNVCVAEPLLYHFESKSRGLDDTPSENKFVCERSCLFEEQI